MLVLRTETAGYTRLPIEAIAVTCNSQHAAVEKKGRVDNNGESGKGSPSIRAEFITSGGSCINVIKSAKKGSHNITHAFTKLPNVFTRHIAILQRPHYTVS